MADEEFTKVAMTTPSAPPACEVKETTHLMGESEECAECWMCHAAQAPWEMIRPCACTGIVHRACLDRWRAVSPNPNSFGACDVCLTPFEFEDDPLLPVDRPCCSPQCKFGLGVTRDIVLVLGVSVCLVLLFGFVIIPAIDPARVRDRFLPSGWSETACDVVWGIVAFFALLGLVGLMVMLVRCMASTCTCCCQGCYQDTDAAHNRVFTASSYPYYGSDIWFCYVCYPIPTPMPSLSPLHGAAAHSSSCGAIGCTCCGSCSNRGDLNHGSGDGGVVLLVIVVAVLAVLGVIFACALLAIIGGRYVHRYRQLVKRYDEVRHQRVRDLSARNPKNVYHMSDLN